MKMRDVVIFVIYDRTSKKVLSEVRRTDSRMKGLVTFPGGTVKQELNETLEQTLERELFEELGIFPKKYFKLTENHIQSDRANIRLHPFFIEEFEGKIPEKILDNRDFLILGNARRSRKFPCQNPKTNRRIVKNSS